MGARCRLRKQARFINIPALARPWCLDWKPFALLQFKRPEFDLCGRRSLQREAGGRLGGSRNQGRPASNSARRARKEARASFGGRKQRWRSTCCRALRRDSPSTLAARHQNWAEGPESIGADRGICLQRRQHHVTLMMDFLSPVSSPRFSETTRCCSLLSGNNISRETNKCGWALCKTIVLLAVRRVAN